MKTVFNIVLVLCAAALIYICYTSITVSYTHLDVYKRQHFYTIEPESEGLIAYWKFDEGSGTVAKDYSVSGYDLTIEKEPKWESVSLPQ